MTFSEHLTFKDILLIKIHIDKMLIHICIYNTYLEIFKTYSHIFNIYSIHIFFNTYIIHVFLINVYIVISVGCILSQPKTQLKRYLNPSLVGFS